MILVGPPPPQPPLPQGKYGHCWSTIPQRWPLQATPPQAEVTSPPPPPPPPPHTHRTHTYRANPANTKTRPNVVSMLVQRRWRCANIETALGQMLAFAGNVAIAGDTAAQFTCNYYCIEWMWKIDFNLSPGFFPYYILDM